MPRKEETDRKKAKEALILKVDALEQQIEMLKKELREAKPNADPQFVEMVTQRIVALEKKLTAAEKEPTIKLPGGPEVKPPKPPAEPEPKPAPKKAAPEKLGGSLYD